MHIKIKKGLDLPVAGGLGADPLKRVIAPSSIAICPDDYPGFIPKVDVEAGATVKAGDALMHHKTDERIKLVTPIAGTVREVVRGERRKILRVVVDAAADGSDVSRRFDLKTMTGVELLAQSGLMALIRQRPYDIVPTVDVRPRDIFVTAFDSAPLAWTPELCEDRKANVEAAVKFLAPLTDGKIYISRRSASNVPDIEGAVMVGVEGPHPASLVGTQISKIKPINKGETVWTLSIYTLNKIGSLLADKAVDWRTPVAVTGSEVRNPYIAITAPGAGVAQLLSGELDAKHDHHVRIISGNMLTGQKIDLDGYLHYPYTQITVIPEGDDVDDFMGWASLSPKKMSLSPTYPGHWLHRLFKPDARTNGGRRAMIMSGQYDRVMPIDVMPEYLIKAINSHDIDNMERLGIYEVAPEDFALAEAVDSSKQPLQSIVRNGLDYLLKELE